MSDGENYGYLFPYEYIGKGKNIIIYGAGDLGQAYLKQMIITGYCKVVAMADRNHEKYPPMVVPVIAPEKISSFLFDYIVIALRVASGINEVERILKNQGISTEKIVCIYERAKKNPNIFLASDTFGGKNTETSRGGEQPIALLVTGGIGDMIIQKRFIMELIQLLPECKIDIYNIKHVPFLEYLWQNVRQIHAIIPDLGFRYRSVYQNYALGITIEACHFLRVDSVREQSFLPGRSDFIRRIHKLQEETDAEHATIATPVHLTNLVRQYNGCNAYSGFNYNGAFEIADRHVDIPLTERGRTEYEKLCMSQYITLNYGNGDCRDGTKIAKMWPRERFEQVIENIRLEFPGIDIVQIGAAEAEPLTGADRYLFGKSFELLAHVLKNAMFHLDIEGGMVHLASQLGTKCVVLFGPTVAEYYGYENNINIRAGNCHNCWGMYTDVNRCVRRLEHPECMEAITVERVMEAVRELMDIVEIEL